MATSKRESYVNVQEVVIANPPAATVENSTNIAGVIVAPVGPLLGMVTSPAQFLETYTVDGTTIPRNSDITFINAYYLSYSTALVLARSVNSKMTGGIIAVADGTSFKFINAYFNDGKLQTHTLDDYFIRVEDINNFQIQMEDTLIYCGELPDDYDNTLNLVEISDYTYLRTAIEQVGGYVVSSIHTELDGALTSGVAMNQARGLNYLPNKYQVAPLANESYTPSVLSRDPSSVGGSGSVSEINGNTITFEGTIDWYPADEELGRAAGHRVGIMITPSVDITDFTNTKLIFGGKVYGESAMDEYDGKKVFWIYPLVTSPNQYFPIEIQWNDKFTENFVVEVKDVKLGEAQSTTGGTIYFSLYSDEDSININGSEVYLDPIVELADTTNWVFSLAANNPLAQSIYEVKINVNRDNLSTYKVFTISFKGINDSEDEWADYNVSFDERAVNRITGSQLYINYLNTLNLDYTLTLYDTYDDGTSKDLYALTEDIQVKDLTEQFGAGMIDLEACKEYPNINQALDTLAEQEIYTIDGLCAFGYTNMQSVIRYQNVGYNNKWFCPIGCPRTETNRRTIAAYFNNLGITDNEMPAGIALGPFDRNQSLTEWVNYIDPSCLYWARVVGNKALRAEFAPVFKETYGNLAYTNPVTLLKKSEREWLLNGNARPINWAVYNERTGVYYLNQNYTFQIAENVVQEENVVRQVWKISRDLKRILDQFISYYNTEATRNKVEEVIDEYFTWNIMNQNFAPEAYTRQCDRDNNTDEIIRANKLAVNVRVRYYGSIKFIEVLNYVYPIGIDFNTTI